MALIRVILGRTAYDGALTAWQEFREIEVEVPESWGNGWHVCGEKIEGSEEK